MEKLFYLQKGRIEISRDTRFPLHSIKFSVHRSSTMRVLSSNLSDFSLEKSYLSPENDDFSDNLSDLSSTGEDISSTERDNLAADGDINTDSEVTITGSEKTNTSNKGLKQSKRGIKPKGRPKSNSNKESLSSKTKKEKGIDEDRVHLSSSLIKNDDLESVKIEKLRELLQMIESSDDDSSASDGKGYSKKESKKQVKIRWY